MLLHSIRLDCVAFDVQSGGYGVVAQLGERLVRNEEVSGSIPLNSTIQKPPGKSSGSSSVAERQLPKLNVAGSIPVSRSKKTPERKLPKEDEAADRIGGPFAEFLEL